jgi:hypothetical protein
MKLPIGLTQVTCRDCGLPVWQGRVDPEVMRKAGWRSQSVFVAPLIAAPERGDMMVNSSGLVVFTKPPRYPGNLERHRCPGKVARCKYCSEPVRILAQPPGSDEILAVVDAESDPRSFLVVNRAGYLVRDDEHVITGDRYRWHTIH